MQAKSVAVIGTGPAGAIAVDALMQERAFDTVRVFERQDQAGGCWYVKHRQFALHGGTGSWLTENTQDLSAR